MSKRTLLAVLALAAAVAALSPTVASAAFLNIAAEDLPPAGLTVATRDRGRVAALAASPRAPSDVNVSCDSRAKVQVELIGSLEKPKKFLCKDKARGIATFILPGLSGLRVSLVSAGGGKPVVLHFILRELAPGGEAHYEAVSLRR